MWWLISKKKHNQIIGKIERDCREEKASLHRDMKRQEARYEEEIQNLLGQLYLQQQEYENAKANYEKAIEIQPDFPED